MKIGEDQDSPSTRASQRHSRDIEINLAARREDDHANHQPRDTAPRRKDVFTRADVEIQAIPAARKSQCTRTDMYTPRSSAGIDGCDARVDLNGITEEPELPLT